ncbi:hypothetical protein V498_03135 [Pseudogymnoascus sp. VKM F-4517 (FW-2822)]|nr:hypothetical protein V498_03135 [Pseudogymnoascus sp. VKM F-4517 (FW-2822)]
MLARTASVSRKGGAETERPGRLHDDLAAAERDGLTVSSTTPSSLPTGGYFVNRGVVPGARGGGNSDLRIDRPCYPAVCLSDIQGRRARTPYAASVVFLYSAEGNALPWILRTPPPPARDAGW